MRSKEIKQLSGLIFALGLGLGATACGDTDGPTKSAPVLYDASNVVDFLNNEPVSSGLCGMAAMYLNRTTLETFYEHQRQTVTVAATARLAGECERFGYGVEEHTTLYEGDPADYYEYP